MQIQENYQDSHLVSSYRPISLLPCISKHFEKQILCLMEEIPLDHNLILNHQFGIRHKHSTIKQVYRIVNIVNNLLQKKEYCPTAFLDLTQAFDKVWHAGLLYRIKSCLPDTLLLIIKSNLQNKKSFVSVADSISYIINISSGVPQGSVLAPTLFLIYTSDFSISTNASLAT